MKKLLLATAATAALASPVFAAGVGTDENIVITGRLEETVPQDLAEVGNRVNVVTAAEILNGGYIDVTQALQSSIPGLYISPLSGPFDYHDASFQGGRTSDLLWQIDGVRINNRLYSTTPPLDTSPAYMIERVEVVEGGQALFFGTQAVAGAVNIVTKEFSATPDGAISVGGGSNQEIHTNGYFRDTIGPHQFFVYGSADHAKGFQPFSDDEYQPSATDRRRGYDVITVGGKYGINFGGDARFSANYQHTAATLDFLNRPKFTAKAFNERKEDLLSAKFDWSPTDNFDLYLKGYYHWWDTEYTEYRNDIANPGNLIVIDDADFWGFEDYGINAVGKYSFGNGIDLYGGYDYQNYWGEDQVFLIKKKTESVHAPFAQLRMTNLVPNLTLAAGVRYNAPSDGPSSTIWNVSGQWDILPTLFVKGSVGTAFRLPDAYELYVVDPCCEQGNPNLKPEESTNFNGSIGGTVPLGMATLRWEAVGFYRDVRKLIVIVFDPVRGIDTFDNSGPKVEVRGGELILGADIGNSFSADFSYSFNSSEQHGTDDQLGDIPESLAKAVFDFHPTDMPFGASVTINHVGDVHRTFDTVEEFGDYTVVDLGVRAFVDEGRKHRIGLNVTNLFDEDYATRVRSTTTDTGTPFIYHYRGMPQSFQVNYTYAF